MEILIGGLVVAIITIMSLPAKAELVKMTPEQTEQALLNALWKTINDEIMELEAQLNAIKGQEQEIQKLKDIWFVKLWDYVVRPRYEYMRKGYGYGYEVSEVTPDDISGVYLSSFIWIVSRYRYDGYERLAISDILAKTRFIDANYSDIKKTAIMSGDQTAIFLDDVANEIKARVLKINQFPKIWGEIGEYDWTRIGWELLYKERRVDYPDGSWVIVPKYTQREVDYVIHSLMQAKGLVKEVPIEA